MDTVQTKTVKGYRFKPEGSTARYMTYGDYCKEYPEGQKSSDAKSREKGWCIIQGEFGTERRKGAKWKSKNIFWVPELVFDMMQAFFGVSHPPSHEHKICKYRRRETRNGVTMDWCYAIGFEELGDLVCEYCNEMKGEKKVNKKSGEGKKI